MEKEEKEFIKSILDVLETERRENYNKKKLHKSSLGVEISLFSDSLIMSYPEKDSITNIDNLFYLIDDINMLQCDLAFKKVFLRGGITCGELYHDKNICFGKAMLDAYQLEQSAVYPRIILSNNILTGAINNMVDKDRSYSEYNTYETEAEEFYKVLKKDADGMWYTDFINQIENFDEIEEYINMLRMIREKCIEEFNSNDNECVKMKYNWLNKKLMETIKNKRLQI